MSVPTRSGKQAVKDRVAGGKYGRRQAMTFEKNRSQGRCFEDPAVLDYRRVKGVESLGLSSPIIWAFKAAS